MPDESPVRPAVFQADLMRSCETCVRLERIGRDPERRDRDGSAALYGLVEHQMEAHGTTAEPLADCPECQDAVYSPDSTITRLSDHWDMHHFVRHKLGIVSDNRYPMEWEDPAYPLRFADMPKPAPLPKLRYTPV